MSFFVIANTALSFLGFDTVRFQRERERERERERKKERKREREREREVEEVSTQRALKQ